MDPISRERGSPVIYNAAIALGSNLGDSFHNIEYALRLLEYLPQEEQLDGIDLPFVRIVNTSFLYKTKPMYVTDQPAFINAACMVYIYIFFLSSRVKFFTYQVETNIFPFALLRLLKKIESVVGRVPSIRHGPRAVDLDIIFCGSDVIDTTRSSKEIIDYNLDGQLVVPHPRVQEREFVLRPLNEYVSSYIYCIIYRLTPVRKHDSGFHPSDLAKKCKVALNRGV